MERIFLGWNRPAVESTVDYLVGRYARGPVWAMDRVLLVVPGGRVGRRLVECLVQEAERRQSALFPPQVVTLGQLPERLYEAKRPFASTLVQHLAWAKALQEVSPACLSEFLADPPADPLDPRWLEMGTLLWSQHCELAADGLNCRAVAEQGEQVEGFTEQARWTALAEVQQAYLRQLDQLELWDRQTARLYAIEHRECRTDLDVILLGTVDMSRALRQMVDQIETRVTALVFADRALENRFDEHGCVRPEAWSRVTLPVTDEQIVVVEGPQAQARAVVAELQTLDASRTWADVTVGVPDEELVPWIERESERAGIPARYGAGRSVEATRPLRLLRALADYLQRQEFANVMELLQHPDFRAVVSRQLPRLAWHQKQLLDYMSQHLPGRTSEAWLGSSEEHAAARKLVEVVEATSEELRGQPRSPADWVLPLAEWLDQVYGDMPADDVTLSQRWIAGGYEAIRRGLVELLRVPDTLSDQVPAWQAILMALAAIPERTIAPPQEPGAVEILGWLELPWDDAPVLMVTQVNEGSVPTSANSDLFLPNALRKSLGLDDNARRYARDAYALHALACSRPSLRLIVARRDRDGYPILPSRLLFAASDEVRAERCLRFFGEESPPEVVEELGADAPASLELSLDEVEQSGAPRQLLAVPQPAAGATVDSFRVTDFRRYLECPYRFYLRNVLYLEGSVEVPRELDGALFGSLVHAVLEAFGNSTARDAEEADAIEEYLLDALSERFAALYGERPRPALQIQRRQIERRLSVFASRQAERRQAGWIIHDTEVDVKTLQTPWSDLYPEVSLRGRVDRIDRHVDSGKFAILDYKSSDSYKSPRENHHACPKSAALDPEVWKDLQLPLYRHLAAEMSLPSPVAMGYALLPRDLEKVQFEMADWSEAELAVADLVARRVVENVRQGIFWPPLDPASSFETAYDRICQVGVFDRLLAETTESPPGG